MANPKTTVWKLDAHTVAKHEILKRYLDAWFPILGQHQSRVVYIDGFAGPGRYEKGEVGSPLIALNAALNQKKPITCEVVFWFIEERDDRMAHLMGELATIKTPPNFRIAPQKGKFHDQVGAMLQSIDADNKALAPTFAFIDPFGFSGIPFSVIEKLLAHKSCEVLITFMVDSINRWLDHPQEKIVQHIEEAFGSKEAVQIAKGGGDRIDKLRNLYQSRLKGVAKFVRYFEMRDRKGRTQYYLFFASNHPAGHVKMKEAMWRVDPDGEFKFSDATDPNQLVLFEVEATPILVKLLRDRFGNKGLVAGAIVRTYVENSTAFLRRHLTAALKEEEAAGRILVDALKSDGQKRRANTYPPEVRLTWA